MLRFYVIMHSVSVQASDIDYMANSELRKLQFFGAGPKAAVPLQVTKGSVAIALIIRLHNAYELMCFGSVLCTLLS